MPDYREVQHGFDIFNRYFLDVAKRKAFTDAFDACSPGVADEGITAFNNWWQDIQLNTYIACLSEHDEFGRPARAIVDVARRGRDSSSILLGCPQNDT